MELAKSIYDSKVGKNVIQLGMHTVSWVMLALLRGLKMCGIVRANDKNKTPNG